MSVWEFLIKQNLIGSGKVRQAAIYGLDGNVWATSSNFKVKRDEIDQLVAAFENPKSIKTKEFCLNGVSYKISTATKNSIYVKNAYGGAVCVKAKKAVVIGVYDENIERCDATGAVEDLGDYLRSSF
jgi:profilin